jgi:hypothetical protein
MKTGDFRRVVWRIRWPAFSETVMLAEVLVEWNLLACSVIVGIKGGVSGARYFYYLLNVKSYRASRLESTPNDCKSKVPMQLSECNFAAYLSLAVTRFLGRMEGLNPLIGNVECKKRWAVKHTRKRKLPRFDDVDLKLVVMIEYYSIMSQLLSWYSTAILPHADMVALTNNPGLICRPLSTTRHS